MKADPRQYVERAVVVVVGLILVGLAKHYLWPVFWRVALSYYAATDVTKTSAFFVSCVALYVAWNNFRHSNWAIVKLVEVSESGQSMLGVNNNQMYSTFDVRIKVLGIPLRNPAVGIQGWTSLGQLSFPLTQFQDGKPHASNGTLEKGMIASYGLRSFDLNAGQRQMVAAVVDPQTERVAICVSSNGYLVKRFLLQRKPPIRKVVRRWNNWAAQFNFRYMSRTRIKWGRPILYTRDIIPKLADRMFPLERFASALKWESENPQTKTHAPWPSGMQVTMFPANLSNAASPKTQV